MYSETYEGIKTMKKQPAVLMTATETWEQAYDPVHSWKTAGMKKTAQ